MKYKDFFLEKYSDWSNEFVHYTKIPHLSFNPKQFHRDPIGYYFFPKDFDPVRMWKTHPFKFVVTIKPTAKILDFSTVTFKEINEIAKAGEVSDKFDVIQDDSIQTMKNLYNSLKEKFTMESAKFNKLFTSLGYDALFDDLKIVYFNEIQLIVLNPKIIQSKKLFRRNDNIYANIQKIVNDLKEKLIPYCDEHEVSKIKTLRNRYNRLKSETFVNLTFTKNEEYYAYIKVYSDSESQAKGAINIYLQYSNPKFDRGIGAQYITVNNEYENDSFDYFINHVIRILNNDVK